MEQQEEKNSTEAKTENISRHDEQAHAIGTESKAAGEGEPAVEASAIDALLAAKEPEYKGALIRLVAFLIDGILVIIFNLIVDAALGIQFSPSSSGEASSTSALATGVSFGVPFVYFVGFWTIWRGITPGKLIVGAKIVRTNGERIGLGRAILRFLGYFIYLVIISLIGLAGHSYIAFFVISLVAFVIVGVNRRKRGLHDIIAGTLVVKRR